MRPKLKQIGPRKMEVISDKGSFVVDLGEKFGGDGSRPNPSELTAAAVASLRRAHGRRLGCQKAQNRIAWRRSGGHRGVRGEARANFEN